MDMNVRVAFHTMEITSMKSFSEVRPVRNVMMAPIRAEYPIPTPFGFLITSTRENMKIETAMMKSDV